jgi:hypothetical protein
VYVIEQRRHARETLGSEELLIIQTPVRLFEYGVSLVGNLAEPVIDGHTLERWKVNESELSIKSDPSDSNGYKPKAVIVAGSLQR